MSENGAWFVSEEDLHMFYLIMSIALNFLLFGLFMYFATAKINKEDD